MKTKGTQKKKITLQNLERTRQLQKARKEFVEGVIAIVLSGGAAPYFVRDCVEDAIRGRKEALRKRELCKWAKKHLNEIILGLELARHALAHLDEIVTEEDDLKALRPHIQEWLEKEGYDSPYRTYPEEELPDRILQQLRGYWDKFDVRAWEQVLDWVALDDRIEAAKPLMAEWLKEKGQPSSKRAVDRFLKKLKDYWGAHGLHDVYDLRAWEAALDSPES